MKQDLFYYKDTSLTLVAYDDEYDFPKLKTSQDKFILGISHEPDTFTQAKDYVHLQLSGHSYGGSVYVPYFGSLFPIDGQRHIIMELMKKRMQLLLFQWNQWSSFFPFKVLCPNQIQLTALNTKSNDTTQNE